MDNLNQSEVYIKFLEAINESNNTEILYKKAFTIIKEFFKSNRVQILEKISDLNELSVIYDFNEVESTSLLAFRFPLLGNELKKNISNKTVWENPNVQDQFFKKYNINSFLGVEFNSNDDVKRILLLTFSESNKKLSSQEINFLIKLTSHLETSFCKLDNYEKSFNKSERLQNQNNKLREQDRLRTNLISNITHEFRTPLSSILGFSKMLASKNLETRMIREISDQIQSAAKRLSALISDFLDINRTTTGGWIPHFEACDIGEIIKNSVEEFTSLNNSHKISYKIMDDYPIFKTDPKLLRQVLDNLISNAIKYSPSQGNIIVSLEFLPNDKEIKVSVSDQGAGIDKDEITKIFNRFYRSQDPNIQKVSGSGLGLSICKEIVTALKGEIEVESEVQKGSTFSISLPI